MARVTDSAGTGEPIRLLMVNTVEAGFNGQTMFILKYLSAMDRSGMRVGFASRGEPLPEIRARLEAMGVEVHPLPPRNRHPLAYARALTRLVRNQRYSIAHVHGNSSTIAIDLLAARLGGARVRIAHSHNTATRYPVVHRVLKPLMLREATARMACGVEAGTWLFGKRPFEVVPIASDPALFAFDGHRRAAARKVMGVDPGDVLVGMVGALSEVKNPGFLLEAMAGARARRPELRLALIGSGPLEEELRQAASRLDLEGSVIFTGAVQDVPERMQALDLLAMPSLYEGFPNVLVEAQLAGLPSLVSDRVTRDCDMTGLLTYLPLKRERWTEALASAARNDRPEASAQAREQITERGYDLQSAAAALLRRYKSLLHGEGKARP